MTSFTQQVELCKDGDPDPNLGQRNDEGELDYIDNDEAKGKYNGKSKDKDVYNKDIEKIKDKFRIEDNTESGPALGSGHDISGNIYISDLSLKPSYLGQKQEVCKTFKEDNTNNHYAQEIFTPQDHGSDVHTDVIATGGATDLSSAPENGSREVLGAPDPLIKHICGIPADSALYEHAAHQMNHSDAHGVSSNMSSSIQQHTFYENLQAWENGTFFKTASKNFDDYKLDISRIKKFKQIDNMDDIDIDKKRYSQRHSKDIPPKGTSMQHDITCISAEDLVFCSSGGATDFFSAPEVCISTEDPVIHSREVFGAPGPHIKSDDSVMPRSEFSHFDRGGVVTATGDSDAPDIVKYLSSSTTPGAVTEASASVQQTPDSPNCQGYDLSAHGKEGFERLKCAAHDIAVNTELVNSVNSVAGSGNLSSDSTGAINLPSSGVSTVGRVFLRNNKQAKSNKSFRIRPRKPNGSHVLYNPLPNSLLNSATSAASHTFNTDNVFFESFSAKRRRLQSRPLPTTLATTNTLHNITGGTIRAASPNVGTPAANPGLGSPDVKDWLTRMFHPPN